MIKKLIPALALTLIAATAGADPADRTTIVDAAVGTPSLSTLVEAVIKADLVPLLDGNRKLTVFAPTNDAFDAAAEALVGPGTSGSELVAALPVEQLTAVLLYHISAGEREAEDVLEKKKLRMLAKAFAIPSVMDGTAFINDAPIEAVDIFVDNGVVHVIGAVLLPPAE